MTASTLTQDQRQAIADYFGPPGGGRHISAGLGTPEEPCSVAGINLALTGRLTDDIPNCMSPVIGTWIIRVQDGMPDEMRNSMAWRSLLPLAAGTGRKHEAKRLEIIMEWMWGTALPLLQPLADSKGFGGPWQHMCAARTEEAARVAARAVSAREAGLAAMMAAGAAAASAVAAAARAAATARAVVDVTELEKLENWATLDPCALLAKLIAVSEDRT